MTLEFALGALIGIALWELAIEMYTAVCEFTAPVTLHIKGIHMAKIGVAQAFTVVAKSAADAIVPDSPITVISDNGSATCDPDGKNGVLIAATAGVANLTATDGKLTAALAVTVDAAVDNTPVRLEIVLG